MIAIKLNLKFLIQIFFIVFLFQTASATSVTTINNLRLIETDNKISIIFDGNKTFNYSLKQAANQIVITVKNAKLTALLNKTWLAKTPIINITSKQTGKNLVLILQLKNAVKFKHDQLKKPARLILNFGPASNETIVKVEQDEVILNEKNIDQIEQQIALQLANNKELIVKPDAMILDPVLSEQKIVNNNTQESMDTVNIISTGNNISSNKSRDIIIVIDPGHGGQDPGAIGFSGTQEKDINLAVSKYLQKIINANKGFKAILTRNDDYFIGLRERLSIAHRYKADMFVAIHADAYISETARGLSIFALSQKGATSEAARWLAKKENESELGRNISNKNTSLKSVLIDLAQAATISASLEIGQSLLYGFKQFAHLHSRKVEQAAFVVLKSPDIPSLLVETGFISDSCEESRLRNPEYQQKIASCLALGVTEYFTNRPPRDTYLAKIKRGPAPFAAGRQTELAVT